MVKLSPSILSADFAKLKEQVDLTERGGSDYIHIDVMDGHFVPNISFGAPVMKSLQGKTKTPFDVHLMIENPDDYIEDFVTENTAFITVHQEACIHLDRTMDYIKSFGVKAGVAINPATPLTTLELVLEQADLILIMSVNPGFGGQKLIPYTLKKIQRLKELREQRQLDFQIEIDGGVTLENVKDVVDAGTDIVVAGSAIFGSKEIEKTTEIFLREMNK